MISGVYCVDDDWKYYRLFEVLEVIEYIELSIVCYSNKI